MKLDYIIKNYNVSEHYNLCTHFMLDCINSIFLSCPTPIKDAIEVARLFWSDESNPVELEKARIMCWDYLDNHNLTLIFEGAEACRIKAVISVLYAEPASDSIEEILGWFIKMMNESGDYEVEVNNALARYFP